MKKHSAGSSLANTACCLEMQRFTIYILHIILPHASLSFAQATSNFARNTLRPHQVCRCVVQRINCQNTNPFFSEQVHPTIWSPSSDLSQAAQDLLQSLGTSFLINSKLICDLSMWVVWKRVVRVVWYTLNASCTSIHEFITVESVETARLVTRETVAHSHSPRVVETPLFNNSPSSIIIIIIIHPGVRVAKGQNQ